MQMRPMKIAVACNNWPNTQALMDAWRVSRPRDTDAKFEDVLKMDTPVTEFMHLDFTVVCPVIIRELICSERDHVVWARSSRVDDLSEWHIWHEAYERSRFLLESSLKRMEAEMLEKTQDEFRMNLPLMYMTTFSWRVSWRKLVALCIGIERLERRLTNPVGKALLLEFLDAISAAMSWHEFFMTAIAERWYRDHEPMPGIDHDFKAGRVGNMLALRVFGTVALRAQLIRHRSLIVNDNMRGFLSHDLALMTATISERCVMHVVSPIEFATQLVRQRSCWIAQSNLWEPFMTGYREALGLTQNTMQAPPLPCDYTDHCPFSRDNELRKAGKDPAPPCPRYANINKQNMSAFHVGQAIDYAGKRQHKEWWLGEITRLGDGA